MRRKRGKPVPGARPVQGRGEMQAPQPGMQQRRMGMEAGRIDPSMQPDMATGGPVGMGQTPDPRDRHAIEPQAQMGQRHPMHNRAHMQESPYRNRRIEVPEVKILKRLR